jgi:predicted ATPase
MTELISTTAMNFVGGGLMLRRIEFENFMSLRNVSIDLEPLTVFVGPNGSGKSAIFKGLVTLSKLLNGAPVRGAKGDFILEAGVNFDDMVWGGNSSLPIKFHLWFLDDGDEPGYTLELRKRAQGWSVTRERIRSGVGYIEVDEDHPFEHPTERVGTRVLKPPLRATLRYLVHPFLNDSAARPVFEPILQFTERFGQAWRYRPSASDIASFVSHRTEPGRTVYVRENGWGVAAELQALQGSKREVFEAIEKAVCTVFPHIKAIGFKTDWQGVGLSFRTDRSEDLIPAPQESDGVLLATFLFWRLYTSKPSYKVCLEEPENGLHPFLLAERFQVLKKFAYQENGLLGVQLLVATHSPEFLRAVKAHPTALWKELRIVEFTPGAGTSVGKLSHYREAAHLISEYLTEVEERWGPVARAWK